MKKGLLTGVSLLTGAIAGAVAMNKLKEQAVDAKAEKIEKFKGYYNMLNQWLVLKQEGKSLTEYFVNNNYKSIAIYGMGEMGNRLYDELKNSEIEVKYAIDKNAAGTYSEVDVIEKDEDFPEVDAIVVAATFAFEAIQEELNEKVDWPIISLEDVVYEI